MASLRLYPESGFRVCQIYSPLFYIIFEGYAFIIINSVVQVSIRIIIIKHIAGGRDLRSPLAIGVAMKRQRSVSFYDLPF